MDLLQGIFRVAGDFAGRHLPPGDLQALLVKGVIQGVGAVVVFLPQICLLFLFIGLLEDTGYMARAAFLMDRLMSKVGLHGKSFIPMLSSFACAIPGIMATRTIETRRRPAGDDPGCAADELFGAVAGLHAVDRGLPAGTDRGRERDHAWHVFAGHRRGAGHGVAVQENIAQGRDADAGDGTAALQAAAVAHRPAAHLGPLQALSAPGRDGDFGHQHLALVPGQLSAARRRPRTPANWTPPQAGQRLRGSFAGQAGRLLEPVIAPLGFDWKIGIGIVSSFAAREVFVSTMSIVYNVAQGTDEDGAHARPGRGHATADDGRTACRSIPR